MAETPQVETPQVETPQVEMATPAITPTNRVGFNIGPDGFNEDTLVDVCRRQRANAHVVIGNPGLAQRIHNETGAIGISRNDWPDDTTTEPGGLIGEWKRLSADNPDIHHYWPNEPHPGSAKDLAALMCHLIDECDAADIKACLGNIAWAASLQPDDVKAGIWDAFLHKASAWTNAGKGVIGGHDYTFGALPWGTAARNEKDMLAGSLPGPDDWPTWSEIWRDGSSDYLMLRWTLLANRAYDMGIPFPRIVITEGFWDRMPNLERLGIIGQLDSQFNGGNESRGLLDQRKFFQHFWPEWSREQAAFEQLQWCENVYPKHVVGFCLFAINTDEKWRGYNLLEYGDGGNGWPELLKIMPNVKGGEHV